MYAQLSDTAWTPQEVIPMVVSVVAVVVSAYTFVVGHRLSKRIALAAGRLRSAQIQHRSPRNGWTIDLVITNGPTETTITAVWLKVAFMVAGTRHRARRIIEFSILPDDFEPFGITGPDLPYRLAPHDQVIWKMRKRMNALGSNDVRYELIVETATDEPLKSERSFEGGGGLFESRFYTERSGYWGRLESMLSHYDRTVPELRAWITSRDTHGYLGTPLP